MNDKIRIPAETVREAGITSFCGFADRPAGTPLVTEDGRPFVLDDAGLELWLPKPPRDGDPVYCRGARVGVVVGDWGTPGQGWLDLVSTEHFPPEIAAKIRAGGEATARANGILFP